MTNSFVCGGTWRLWHMESSVGKLSILDNLGGGKSQILQFLTLIIQWFLSFFYNFKLFVFHSNSAHLIETALFLCRPSSATSSMYLQNKVMHLQNKVMYLQNEVMYLQNKVMYLQNKVMRWATFYLRDRTAFKIHPVTGWVFDSNFSRVQSHASLPTTYCRAPLTG